MTKIFFVGDFRKTYSTEVYIADALEALGCDVKRWQEDAEATLNAITGYTIDWKPDFVLFSKNRLYSNGKKYVERLEEAGIPTVAWIFDLYTDLPKEMGVWRSLHDAPFSCDYVFMTDGRDLEAFSHFEKLTLRQGVYAKEAKTGKPYDIGADIVFIGTNTYRERSLMLRFLKNTYGERFKHYGAGGDEPEIRGMALNDVIASAKIVIGDSVPADHYWSNRIYEMLGRGAFLVHPKVKGLEKEFKYYKHFVPFDYGNHEQLKEIIDYYLRKDEERKKIQTAGHNYCKKHYTYKKRCQSLLDTISEKLQLRTSQT